MARAVTVPNLHLSRLLSRLKQRLRPRKKSRKSPSQLRILKVMERSERTIKLLEHQAARSRLKSVKKRRKKKKRFGAGGRKKSTLMVANGRAWSTKDPCSTILMYHFLLISNSITITSM